jgi:hypothetical protein
VAVVALNRSDAAQGCTLVVDGRWAEVQVPGHGIATFMG